MANELSRSRVAKATYSFALDTTVGAVGTVVLASTEDIPIGALITGVLVDSRTITTGGGGCQVAIAGGGLTLVAAQTLAGQELDETGPAWLAAAGNESTAVYVPQKASSSAVISVAVTVAAITAGIFDIYVHYDI